MFLDHSLGGKEESTPNYVNYGFVQDTKYEKKHSNFNVYLVNQSETTFKDFMFLYNTMVPYYNSLIQVYEHCNNVFLDFYLCCGGASHWAHI